MVSYYPPAQKADIPADLLCSLSPAAKTQHVTGRDQSKSALIFLQAGCCTMKFQSMIRPLWPKQDVS